MAYSPTNWINDNPPALSAANLNKLTAEVMAQATALGVTNSLPTWVDGALPALTDDGPFNEIERVVELVALNYGLTYTKTTWGVGWSPPRNAANLNKLEQQVRANSQAAEQQPSELPFAEAALRTGYATATIAAGAQTWTPPSSSVDYLVDLQWTLRHGTLLIYGYPGQRIHLKNGNWLCDMAMSTGAYWRGGPGVRSVGNNVNGPEHVSFTGLYVRGPRQVDHFVVDAGNNTKVTVQKARFESCRYGYGTDNPEPAQHPDNFHVQGKCGRLEVGLATLYPESHTLADRGKGFMLNQNVGPYDVYLDQVNFIQLGNVQAMVYKDAAHTGSVYVSDVYVDTTASSNSLTTWQGGKQMFYPETWTRFGSEGSYYGDYTNAVQTYGVWRQGRPPGGDYCTLAMLGL